jgi:glutamyl-tRNA(Gln) amidotransferase subunit E
MKIGIEIHQRLDCGKLFCNCPSVITDEEPDQVVRRKLHPVFSELGEIDEASEAEFSRERSFLYHYFSKSDCLIEMDEEPPFPMNSAALDIALQVALELNARIVDEMHIMRKLVIDGSNTSGFQRTAVVGMDGRIDTSRGSVSITTLGIEEESAGIGEADGSIATYRLDRLGIPLLEITTAPDIKDGRHLREVAEKLGLLLRATGKVARGLGTIRQDVNISTEGGARVEIKGAQDLKMLPKFVELEAERQEELIKIILELSRKNAFGFEPKIKDVSSVFSKTASPLVSKGIKSGGSVMAMRIPLHAGFLGRQIQSGRRYGSELSDYAKIAGVKGLIHSDEDLSKYKISKEESDLLFSILGLLPEDAFIMVVAPERMARRALEFAAKRALMDFVPGETRKARPDGTTSYMRPLPGKARLYPETDIIPLKITSQMLDHVRETSGDSLADKEKELGRLLNSEMAKRMLRSRELPLFEKLVAKGHDPKLAAVTLEETLVSLRREGIELQDKQAALFDLFSEYEEGHFVKAAIPEILRYMAKGASAESVVKVHRLQKITGAELESLIASENYELKSIMRKYRLQVDPAEVSKIIKSKK